MATDLLTDRHDTVGPWSEHFKLDVLGRYLPAYTTVMNQQRRWCSGFHYVDGFAGTGTPRARGEDRWVQGSPRIALDLDPPFDAYTFVERDPWRAAQLRELRDKYPHRRIRVVEGDCNAAIPRLITPVVRHEHRARGVAFLDPFGTELRFETVAAIADTGAMEVILNLSTMAMNRTGLPNDPDALTAAHAERMTRVWGDESWLPLFYGRRDDLFGGSHVVKAAPTGAVRLGRLFKEHRLGRVFPFVTEPLVVRNTRGAPIYCLLWAGHNATGQRIAEQVFGSPPRLAPPPPEAATLPLFG